MLRVLQSMIWRIAYSQVAASNESSRSLPSNLDRKRVRIRTALGLAVEMRHLTLKGHLWRRNCVLFVNQTNGMQERYNNRVVRCRLVLFEYTKCRQQELERLPRLAQFGILLASPIKSLSDNWRFFTRLFYVDFQTFLKQQKRMRVVVRVIVRGPEAISR